MGLIDNLVDKMGGGVADKKGIKGTALRIVAFILTLLIMWVGIYFIIQAILSAVLSMFDKRTPFFIVWYGAMTLAAIITLWITWGTRMWRAFGVFYIKGDGNGMLSSHDFEKIASAFFEIQNANKPIGWVCESVAKNSKFNKNEKLNFRVINNLNVIAYAITRAGKTSKLVLPTIYCNAVAVEQKKPCFIITDKKNELIQKTFAFLKEHGYRIWHLNIANGFISNSLNPLSNVWELYHKYLETRNDVYLSEMDKEINNITDMLFMSGRTTLNEDFFNKSAGGYLEFLIYFLLDNNICLRDFTFSNILKLFNNVSTDFLLWAVGHMPKDSLCISRLYILNDAGKSQATIGGIKATMGTNMKFFTNKSICALTDKTDINLDDFDKKPTALFISIPPNADSNDTKLVSIYTQMLLRKFINQPDREGNKEARDIMFIGDEIGNISQIKGLSEIITTGLSKKISSLLMFQSRSQLREKYHNEADTIEENCALKIILKTSDNDLATEWSKSFGTIEKYINETNTVNNKTVTKKVKRTVPILKSEEILKLPNDKMLCYITSKPPYLAKSVFIHDTQWYQQNIESKILSNAMISKNGVKFDVDSIQANQANGESTLEDMLNDYKKIYEAEIRAARERRRKNKETAEKSQKEYEESLKKAETTENNKKSKVAKSKKKQKINNLPSKTGIAAQKEYAKFIAIARAKKEKKGKK